MIVASNENVVMNGKGGELLNEFVYIAHALLDFEQVTPDRLKAMIDFAEREIKEEPGNEHTSN